MPSLPLSRKRSSPRTHGQPASPRSAKAKRHPSSGTSSARSQAKKEQRRAKGAPLAATPPLRDSPCRTMTATPEMAEYCLRVIAQQINSPDAPPVQLPAIPKEDSACFVTLTTLPDDRLRGCIGSLCPGSLRKDMRRLAIAAAFQDSRFPKVRGEELPTLRCCFSLLHTFEQCSAWNDWEIGKHGLVADYDGYSATYLPSVAEEQGWNHRETLVSLMEKAGFEEPVTDRVLSKVHVTRYQVSKAFKDYKDIAAS
ncbi:hypothetical protein LSCM1_01703 [Leishmania martiniquensis]|uniref:AMMECR1 domain-containing protein n=1 Tax=Leishmania martiniquensis TaxID=1580590 RepID=A0A836GBR9_9TRYP|nr:hypothetical protein LSCM1_01703 [Leishmania martiniquensis]